MHKTNFDNFDNKFRNKYKVFHEPGKRFVTVYIQPLHPKHELSKMYRNWGKVVDLISPFLADLEVD